MVEEVARVVNEIIQVDVFDKIGSEVSEGPDYVRPALRHTKFEAMSRAQSAAMAV